MVDFSSLPPLLPPSPFKSERAGRTSRKTGTRKIGGRSAGRQSAGSQATGGQIDRRKIDRRQVYILKFCEGKRGGDQAEGALF